MSNLPNLAATLDPNEDWKVPNDTENNPDQPGEEKISNCTIPMFFTCSHDYSVVTATICMLYLFFGVFCTFFGYRCFKGTMFLMGFVFGSLVVYLICMEEEVLPPWANTSIAVSAGVLFGLITLLVQYVGLFMLGFHGGLILGIIILCSFEIFGHSLSSPDSGDPWISVGILLLCGLVMSLCNLYFQRVLTIFNAALYGGAVITTSLDYFVEHSVMLKWVWDRVCVRKSDPLSWESWAIAGAWPLTFILGIILQVWLTKDGIYHEEQFPPIKRRRNKHETREERKQRKYRYLYQVRTCHGDVISQPISNKYVTQIDESHA